MGKTDGKRHVLAARGAVVSLLSLVRNKLLYGGTPSLRPYEMACLERFRETLSPPDQRTLEAQMRGIEWVQRQLKDKLVVIQVPRDKNLPRFPNHSVECRASRLKIKPASGRSLSVDVVFSGGRLATLEYTAVPTGLSAGAMTFVSAQTLQDVTAPDDPQAQDPPSMGPMLLALNRVAPVRDVLPPATDAETTTFLEPLGVVPEDYVALLRETNGFSVKGWRFTGTRARRVLLHGHLWLAAESAQEALCLQERSTRPTILHFDQIDDETTDRGRSFAEALLEVISSEALADS